MASPRHVHSMTAFARAEQAGLGGPQVQFAGQGREHPAARRADGMAERDTRAVDVEPVEVGLAEAGGDTVTAQAARGAMEDLWRLHAGACAPSRTRRQG